MKQSISYYLTILVLKLKGLKRIFSEDPIDFIKLRKEDVRHPSNKLFNTYNGRKFKIAKSSITALKPNQNTEKLLIFIHGGAFISGPAKHHWDGINEILKHTNHAVWMCDYPKAPEHKIDEISNNIDEVYQAALEKYDAHQITLLGDSVGGTLVTALTQRLIQTNQQLPAKIILVSPVMDATMSNPEIEEIENRDPMLSRIGIRSAKKMCVADGDLKNVMISPICGNFSKFPKTILFLGENDITYADQKILVQKLEEAKVDTEIMEGKNMPHIWPLLPVMKEAKLALNKIIASLNHGE